MTLTQTATDYFSRAEAYAETLRPTKTEEEGELNASFPISGDTLVDIALDEIESVWNEIKSDREELSYIIRSYTEEGFVTLYLHDIKLEGDEERFVAGWSYEAESAVLMNYLPHQNAVILHFITAAVFPQVRAFPTEEEAAEQFRWSGEQGTSLGFAARLPSYFSGNRIELTDAVVDFLADEGIIVEGDDVELSWGEISRNHAQVITVEGFTVSLDEHPRMFVLSYQGRVFLGYSCEDQHIHFIFPAE